MRREKDPGFISETHASLVGGDVARSTDVSAGPGLEELLPAALDGRTVEALTGLRRLAAGVLGVEPARVALDRPLVALGLDSLGAAELSAAIESELGVQAPIADLLAGATLEELAVAAPSPSCPTPLAAAAGLSTAAAAAYPLSHGQRALWLLDRLGEGGSAYVIAGAARVPEGLSGDALRAAFQALVARHPALRTTFALRGETAVQVVGAEAAAEIREEDARAWSDAELAERLAAEAERDFDLARGPLVRLSLFRRGGPRREGDVVMLAVHHIVADFQSLAVMLGELGALYGRRPLPLPACRYSDFVRWEAERLAGPEGERLWSYWSAALSGGAPPLALPTDRPRLPRQSFAGGTRTARLGIETGAGLQALGRRAGATPFMTLLAVFLVLLHRYGDQEDLLVGTPTSGRGSPALAGVVGYLVNPVVVRGDLAGNPCFEALLARVRSAAVAAFAHAGLPFSLLAERLGGERDPSRSPIFQAMFVLYQERRRQDRGLGALALGEGGAALELAGLEAVSVALPRRSAPFDLTLQVAEIDGALAASLQFNSDLFDAATAQRMLAQLGALATAVGAGAPGTAPPADGTAAGSAGVGVRALPLLSPAESHQLRVEWNDTAAASAGAAVPAGRRAEPPAVLPARTARVHELCEWQAARRPWAPAVAGQGTALTYGELDGRANQLARYLRRLAVGPEVRVAICLERTPEMVVALLAILKAGGAYVPLDPDHPAGRLALVLADSAPAVLVTEERWLERLAIRADGTGGEPLVVCLDRERDWIAGEEATAVDGPAWPEALAYVIYTSGSTGRPKGVALPHRAVVNLLRAMAERPGLGAGDAMPALTTLAFDIAGLEVYLPLAVGGRVEMLGRDEAADGRRLAARLAGSAVTAMQATPATWRLLLEAGWRDPAAAAGGSAAPPAREPGPDRPIKALCGGEALPPELAAALLARGVELWNVYGPTETAIWSTTSRVRAPPAAVLGAGTPEGRVSLGRPIASTRCFVVDRELRPVPVGASGELLIGGAGVARGYWGNPQLTAARFVPDAWSGEVGERVYRTGDLVRYDPAGELHFLGRLDHQVKVRGYRIELGEIEAALLHHPEVRRAVVVALGEELDRRLVAYLVPRAGGGPTADAAADAPAAGPAPAALQEHLRRRLPDYMVPAAFVVLQSLPLGPSGKIDRRALPAPPPPRGPGEAGAARIAPRTAAENLVAELWAEVLGVERVAVGDDFFRLGGHSLLALRVAARLRERHRIEVPLSRLLKLSRLEELAREVEELGRAGLPQPPPIHALPRARGETLAAELSFAQERLWFLDQLEPATATYNLPGALRLRGALAAAALAAALAAIRRRHEVLRTRFVPQPAGGVLAVAAATVAGRELALPLIDLSALPAGPRQTTARCLIAAEARRPFDLAAGPVLRTSLLCLNRPKAPPSTAAPAVATAPSGAGAAEHVLLLTLHHIAGDGWSLDVLARELSVLYTYTAGLAAVAQEAPPALPALPALPIQYADFAAWERRWLAGEALEAQLGYWRERLAGEAPETPAGGRGEPPRLDLPLDRPRPPVGSRRGARVAFALPAGLTGELAALAQRHGATLFMALLALLDTLLWRYTGQVDLAVGTPIANRGRRETEDLIGLFVNTLVLRLDLAGDPSFDELLARARRTAMGAYANQDLPFDKLVAELAPHREIAETPFFQVVLAQQPRPPALQLPGLAVEILDTDSGTSKFDLSLAVTATAEGALAGTWIYRLDLFAAATIERLGAQLRTLAAGVVARPASRLSELPLLSAAERHQLLVEWSASAWDGRGDGLVHTRFERQAARTPGAPALVATVPGALGATAERILSYGELAAWAGRLAARLRALGAGPERIVGICAEPSFALVAGLLGILEAGSAYLPLDPQLPRERLSQMIAAAGAELVLAAPEMAPRLPPAPAARLVWLEESDGRPGERTEATVPDGLPGPRLDPDNAAYVLFTSGSTGVPKGVVVPHRAVVNRLRFQEAMDLTADARVLQRTRCSFDVSVVELFAPLRAGATLVLADGARQQDAAYLARLLAERRVTHLNAPPGLLPALLAEESFRGNRWLRRVVIGGDRLPGELPRQFFDAMQEPAPALVNRYGPTEATVSVSEWNCRPGADLEAAPVIIPLGRPIAGARLYVLDRGFREVPPPAAGELAIGGVCLARGYLGRPDATAAAFVPDPFARLAGEAGGRLYRTGDLARWRVDGALEFLGRTDRQVKVRGFRVELGEVEAALARHPAVADVAVVAGEAPAGGGTRLVAYLVAGNGAAAATSSPVAAVDPAALAAPRLRAYLAERLPAYMLPAAFVTLPRLPLTANGKLDRAALPAPESMAGAGATPLDAPRSALEQQLAGIWAELLGRETVGVEQDFFELGGHSLLATRLVNQVRTALGVELPLQSVFARPTVAALALTVEELRREPGVEPGAEPRALGAPISPPSPPPPTSPSSSREPAPPVPMKTDAAAAAAPTAERPAAGGPDEMDLERAARHLRVLGPRPGAAPPRLERALFVLSPPRSGSTLLRVMLAGHPRLFAPPELELLGFHSLAERRDAFGERGAFRLEGTVRAVMEARGCGAEAAQALLGGLEAGGLGTHDLYGLLQQWIGERMLVDKTPSYAWDPGALRRAEECFAEPLYLHLTRHPYGTIRSFEEARIDQIFFPAEHPWTRRRLAELLWTLAHGNILAFLATVPRGRQHRVAFERLVRDPEAELRRICAFAGLAFDPAMAAPYPPGPARMTDGLHAASRMIGDIDFLQHQAVDPAVAERWREWLGNDDFMAEPSRRLALRLGYDLEAAADAGAAAPRPVERELPLSFAQERLWFLERLVPGKATYHIASLLLLRGALDVAALQAALAEVVRRHAVLRTTYREENGLPVQTVAPWRRASAPVPLLIDLAALPEIRPQAAPGPGPRETELGRCVLAAGDLPFDLERGPVLRAVLLRLSAREHQLVFVMHHIASDGWSVGVLVREVTAFYAAARRGARAPLPEPPLQYADYAVWQRQWLAGERLQREVEHWRRRLAGAPALDLPLDRPRPAVLGSRGARRQFGIDGGETAALMELARRLGATLFMTTLAGFAVVLGRHAGQEDLSVGTPHAGRGHLDLEGLIGFFVNTLVLRLDLAGEPRFAELVGRVRDVALGAFSHHEVPFEKVVEELRPERDLARAPLFQVMFLVQNAPLGALSLPGLAVDIGSFPASTAKFELSVQLREHDGKLEGSIEYNRDLFEAATAARLADHFTALLASAVEDPARRLGELALWRDAERWQVMGEWASGGAAKAGGAGGIHGLIAARAAAWPEAVAVSRGWERLRFGELEARANRLARRLRRLGVGRESRVALLVERTPELVVALLAILKAGGAYVPLDPGHPEERLRLVLADSGARLVLTEREVWQRLGAALQGGGEPAAGAAAGAPAGTAAAAGARSAPRAWKVALLDAASERAATAAEPSAPLAWEGAAESLAYVIYTSGSTGRPKGVALSHGALASFLLAMAERPGVAATGNECRDWRQSEPRPPSNECRDRRPSEPRPGAVVPALTTIAFDIAGLEIFLPLLQGAQVEVVSREEAADGERLAVRLAACDATLVQATPATWRLLLAAGWSGGRGVRALCGGEALDWDLAGELVERGCELWNVYGPTETAVWSALRRVGGDGHLDGAVTGASVPLGRPLAGTVFRVVDAAGRPVAVGLVGELWIGGAGLARGYWGRPDLTAERFVPDPWALAPGARLYRTGDLVRWRGGGELEFLGRRDHQVKVRGFRIELGEVEAALLAQPEVAQAVVLAQGEGAQRRLLACVVARGPAPSERELRERLRRLLPDYMLPAAFRVLERLPLTPTGKVDRLACAQLGAPAEQAASDLGDLAPRGPVEELLAGIWGELLQRDRVSARDHFFELGGHSLLATQLVSRVRHALGVELPLQQIFLHPTLAGLAGAIEELRRAGSGTLLPPIVREPRGGDVPLSFAQERMWFLAQLDPGAAYNLVQAVRLRGRLDEAVLARCFGEVMRRHEALRTRFAAAPGGGSPVQVVEPPAPFRLPRLDLAALPPAVRQDEARRLAGREASRPFDLARGPLLRAALLLAPGDQDDGQGDEAAAEHALVLVMHHIIADGWSLAILVRELVSLYAAFAAGRPSPLPELPLQYADYALWQRRFLTGERLGAEVEFWRRQLAGCPPALQLPADRRRAGQQGFQVGETVRLLPRTLLDSLVALARRSSASLYMVLLAAWKALLLRATGRDDLVVGAPIANRNRAETEGLIGFFLNTLLLRTELAGVPDFAALLGKVRETCLGAFDHQDLPLEQVFRAAFPERDHGLGPPLQVMFLLQNVVQGELSAPGLAFSPLGGEQRPEALGTAIFEVGLTLQEPRPEAPEAPLFAHLTWNARLFDTATMERLLARYERLLAAAAADPERDLWAYPLLADGEERQLLAAGGARERRQRHQRSARLDPATAPGGEEPAVHALVAQRAAAAPEAVAVAAGAGGDGLMGEALSYGELERRANRLAWHLRRRGLGPERVAGLALERSPRLVIALLAILKAGGAYLPLDPGHPEERLRETLGDAGAALLVTTRAVLAARPRLAAAGVPVVCLEEEEAAVAACPAEAPAVGAGGEALAAVIYTSGSTGRPKGVMVRHAALASYVRAVCDDYRIGPGDRVLQFASISFDASAEEIFPTLAGGAALVLRDEAMLASAAAFLERCDELGITVLDLPTAWWHQLAPGGTGPAAALPAALRLLLIGGERALAEPLRAWQRWTGERVRLVNTYGPTETTIVATRAELPAAAPPAGEVPIGRPVRDVRAYVLDPRGGLAPAGFPGELFVAGAGVARGYLGRPGATAERFLPDPFWPLPGARMYRTGDLARWLPAGELEFLGRADQQVKIRGFRVEPAEIEAALAAHPAVAQAAVVAREERSGGQRLAAYWVRSDGESPAAGELRSWLALRLPDYMLPASFIELEAMPLTPGGKVDRRSLPAPQRLRPAVAAGYLAPRTGIEEKVAAIWAEVLGLDRIGVHDNFFELGGHSLLIPQVLYRLEAAFGIAVPLRSLFDGPTVEGQALTVEELVVGEIEERPPGPAGEHGAGRHA